MNIIRPISELSISYKKYKLHKAKELWYVLIYIFSYRIPMIKRIPLMLEVDNNGIFIKLVK